MDQIDTVIHHIKSVIKWLLLLIVSMFFLIQIINLNFLGALITLLTGILLAILLFKKFELGGKFYMVFAMSIGVITLIGALSKAKIINPNLMRKNQEMALKAAKLDSCRSFIGDTEKIIKFRNLKDELFSTCMMQNNNELSALVWEVFKIRHTDPFSSLILDMFSEFNGDESKSCQDVTVEIKQLCPELNL